MITTNLNPLNQITEGFELMHKVNHSSRSLNSKRKFGKIYGNASQWGAFYAF